MAEFRNCSRTNQSRTARLASVMAARIFDSRSERECLENTQVFFSDDASREAVEEATLVKAVSADVVDVIIDVEPVHLNDGCYTVDCTYYFSVNLNAYRTREDSPTPVTGRAFHTTRTVLFGGKGGVKTFSSTGATGADSPVATVQVSQPVLLSAYITQELPEDQEEECKVVRATLGLFTVTSLERPVQMTLPVYRYGVPAVRGALQGEEDPCDVFRRLRFPVGRFSPE